MAVCKAGALLCAAFAVSLAATGAQAKARTPRASAPPAAAPAVSPPAAYVPAPRRTQPPALALRPEFSEGEWSELAGVDQLDPAALASSSAPVGVDGGRLETARVGSTLAKISERQLQGAPIPTSRLDQPMTAAPGDPVTMPEGFRFTPSGFTVNSATMN